MKYFLRRVKAASARNYEWIQEVVCGDGDYEAGRRGGRKDQAGEGASHEQLRSLRSILKNVKQEEVMRLNFFSNFYGKTEISRLFILIFKIIIYRA